MADHFLGDTDLETERLLEAASALPLDADREWDVDRRTGDLERDLDLRAEERGLRGDGLRVLLRGDGLPRLPRLLLRDRERRLPPDRERLLRRPPRRSQSYA